MFIEDIKNIVIIINIIIKNVIEQYQKFLKVHYHLYFIFFKQKLYIIGTTLHIYRDHADAV